MSLGCREFHDATCSAEGMDQGAAAEWTRNSLKDELIPLAWVAESADALVFTIDAPKGPRDLVRFR